jgi:hypothetical protein
MTQPIVITLPHRLGKAEAPRTILVGVRTDSPGGSLKRAVAPFVVESKSKSWVRRTCARAVTNSRMQASDTRLGRGRANQFGSLPRLPT